MPIVGINTKIHYSNNTARTVLNSFYKSISASSVTTKIIDIPAGLTGGISLTQSEFLIIIGTKSTLNITLTNSNSEQLLLENTGFFMIQASNLISVNIQNTDTEAQQVTLFF